MTKTKKSIIVVSEIATITATVVENPHDPTPYRMLCDYLCEKHEHEQYVRDFADWCNDGPEPSTEWLNDLFTGAFMPLELGEGLLRIWCVSPKSLKSPRAFVGDIEASVKDGKMRWTTRSRTDITPRGRHRKVTLSTSEVVQHVYDNDGIKGIIALAMSARYFRQPRNKLNDLLFDN